MCYREQRSTEECTWPQSELCTTFQRPHITVPTTLLYVIKLLHYICDLYTAVHNSVYGEDTWENGRGQHGHPSTHFYVAKDNNKQSGRPTINVHSK